MKNQLNRRDFLNILGLLPLSCFGSHIHPSLVNGNVKSQLNVLIIVFDAFSSHNISLYGYPRKTTPHLELLAERATIYHNHYSAGNFTTPGTASILTGTYPWTHRAFQINSKVHKSFQTRNIYSLFNDYYRMTYSHNPLVNILQDPFSGDIDLYKLREDLTLSNNLWLTKYFENDPDTASVSWARITGKSEEGISTSLFFSNLFNFFDEQRNKLMEKEFPLGLPLCSLDHFLLEDAIDWLKSKIVNIPRPFLGYFHFMPPHAPYKTRIDFVNSFSEIELQIKTKPRHPLARTGRIKQKQSTNQLRLTYDEFILYVDSEFNRLFLTLEDAGVLDNTVVILTSDHGEMFERGILGHTTPCLHNPVVKIPLVIFEPGQKDRKDVYANTSAVDLLPTVLQLTGKSIPTWIDGTVLPPYKPSPGRRSVYALEAKTNKPLQPLTSASAMIVKGQYKLTKYFGYRYLPKSDTLIELYDIDNDPEEINEISATYPRITTELLEELEAKIKSADQPYS